MTIQKRKPHCSSSLGPQIWVSLQEPGHKLRVHDVDIQKSNFITSVTRVLFLHYLHTSFDYKYKFGLYSKHMAIS